MKDLVVIAAFVITPLSGVVTFRLALRFLWRVYARGGAVDLAAAATALLLARGIQPKDRGLPAAFDSGNEQRGERLCESHRQDGLADEACPRCSFLPTDPGRED